MENKNQSEIKYAGFWIRWVANLIDALVLLIPSILAALIIKKFIASVNVRLILDGVSGLLFSWVYFILMTRKYQATLGKAALGIRVISDASENLAWGQIILRETIGKIISMVILFIGYIMAGFTQRKQALHDKIARTLVIYKDPEKKVRVWLIITAVIGFILLAIAGISTPIVLKNLSDAKNKASDTAIRSSLTAAIPEAIAYAKGNNNSYKDFKPAITLTPDIQKCSGQPIVNISPDGKSLAIFAKLCSVTGKYFCIDVNNKSQVVDEQYVKGGAYACNLVKISTREAYTKSLALLKNRTNVKLKSIDIDRITPNYASKIQFAFTTDSGAVIIYYDVVSKIAQIVGTPALSADEIKKVPFLDPSYPALPDAMLSSGFEGAMKLLSGNSDYQNYKAKNPDVFLKYTAFTDYSDQYGWEWHIMFVKTGTSASDSSSILFAVNPEKKQVVVTTKNNLAE